MDYLIVDSYFRQNYSKYEYDITFDFITPLYEKDQVIFDDILKGTETLEELIEKNEINFTKPDFRIDQHLNENFKITYHDLEFSNLTAGEAIPVLIVLSTLLDAKPVVSLSQIEEEVQFFIEKFREYGNPDENY